MRAILVSVDFGDILALTLPYNRHHFTDVFVVTIPRDHLTMRVANDNNSHVLATDLFTANGAVFNKFAALEWGLEQMGRHGWIVIMDADCFWPKSVPCDEVAGRVPPWFPVAGNLYTPMRHLLTDVTKPVPPESEWSKLPLHRYQQEWSGFTQMFHAHDAHLGPPPWHEINWRHAGGGDSFFQEKWPPARKLRPPFAVLCLGPDNAQNWCGRSMPYVDGTLPEGADERHSAVRNMLAARVGRTKETRYAAEKLE